MVGHRGYRVRRVEPPDDVPEHDYADSFALELDEPDAHSAEQWARAALEGASPLVRGVVRLAQAHVLRLRLRPPGDPAAVLGWPVVRCTSEVVHLRAAGPLVTGDVVGRRTSPRRVVVTTSLVFERRAARVLWSVVGPLHRAVAPHLLRVAASSLADRPDRDGPRPG